MYLLSEHRTNVSTKGADMLPKRALQVCEVLPVWAVRFPFESVKLCCTNWAATPPSILQHMKCEVARMLKLTGDSVEPISFVVPRKVSASSVMSSKPALALMPSPLLPGCSVRVFPGRHLPRHVRWQAIAGGWSLVWRPQRSAKEDVSGPRQGRRRVRGWRIRCACLCCRCQLCPRPCSCPCPCCSRFCPCPCSRAHPCGSVRGRRVPRSHALRLNCVCY